MGGNATILQSQEDASALLFFNFFFSPNGQDTQPNKLRIPYTGTSKIHNSLLLGILYQSEPKKLSLTELLKVFFTLNHGGYISSNFRRPTSLPKSTYAKTIYM